MAGKYGENLTAFLRQYVNFRRDAYNADGTLTDDAVRLALALLLDSNVFDTPEEIRQEAFDEYGIFIPPSLFENERGEK